MSSARYCRSTSHHNSDDELFALALARKVYDVRGLPEKPTSGDTDEYIKKNKDCCVIVSEGPFPEGIFDRLLASGTWIQVLYELEPNPSHGNHTGYEAFANVGGCGQVGHYYDMSIGRDEMLAKKLANKSVK